MVALRHAINAAISATSKAHDATSSMLAPKLYGWSVKHAVIRHAMPPQQFFDLLRTLTRKLRVLALLD